MPVTILTTALALLDAAIIGGLLGTLLYTRPWRKGR